MRYRYIAPFESNRFNDLYATRVIEREVVLEGGFIQYRHEVVKPKQLTPNGARHRRYSEMVKIPVSGKSGSFKGLEPGIYNARCDLVADLGMQDTGKYGMKHKVYLRFSVPDQTGEREDGTKFQMSIGSKFTATLSKRATLRKVLESWRGRPFTEEELENFELTNLLNAPATLVVGSYTDKEGNPRPSIDNVLKCKSPVDELLEKAIAVSAESPEEDLAKVPEWLRNTILEAAGGHTPAGAEQESQSAAHQAEDEAGWADPDDIPF